jgi:hypothetical protein
VVNSLFPSVKSVDLVTLESFPPQIWIRVVGEAPNSGWSETGFLNQYLYFVPPADGIYEFDLLAFSPDDSAITNPVITQIEASFVITAIPDGFVGVKVYGKNDFIVSEYDASITVLNEAEYVGLEGVGSSGGGRFPMTSAGTAASTEN